MAKLFAIFGTYGPVLITAEELEQNYEMPYGSQSRILIKGMLSL